MNPSNSESATTVTARSQELLGNAVASLVVRVACHPGRVLAFAACVVSLSAIAVTTRLSVNADQDAMFSEDLPHRVAEIAYMQEFPALYENIVVVVDGASERAVRDAALLLAERMRNESRLFRNVYLPRGDFFERHALLYLSTDEVEDFADRLARVQPYLAGLAEDGTLRGFANLLERGTRAAREGGIESSELAPIFERLTDALRANLAGKPYEFSWAEVAGGDVFDEAANTASPARPRRLVIAQPVLDFNELAVAGAPLDALRRFADELDRAGANVRVRVTGDVALAYEEMTQLERQAALAGLASFAMVTALLAVALRSVRLVLAVACSLLAGLVVTAGFAAIAVGHLNLVSVAFAVLFIGLAADFSLHLCLRFQELVAAGVGRRDALADTARGVGGSLVLCAATSAIGFLAFVPTDFAGVAELGMIAGVGMGIGLLATLTVVPAILSLGAEPDGAKGLATTASLPTFPLRYPRGVLVAAALVTFAALAVMPQVRFDPNPLRVRDPAAESVVTFQELLEQAGTSPWNMAAIAPDLDAALELARALRRLPVVEDARTIADFIPGEQDEKLAILEDAALFLAPTPTAAAGAPDTAAQLEALRELGAELRRLERSAEPNLGGLLPVAAALRGALEDFLEEAGGAQAVERVDLLQRSLIGSLDDQLETLDRLLSAGPVGFDDLPPELSSRMVSATGSVRVEIQPAEDLNDADALARFVGEVRGVAPGATGSAVAIHESSRTVVRALREALGAAVVVIALLLLWIWRTLGDTLLVLVPLGLAALLTTATAVAIGIPFNFADVIVVPLLLGIGVDSGIHLVHRARSSRAEPGRLLSTSTARAVVFSALTTIASFGSLAFATHRGMATLGQLLTLGVAVTVLCNLIVLPALIVLRERARAR